MKIGLISDIHNHAAALQRALQIFKRNQVDQIVCMGDVVEEGDGLNADETVQAIQANNIPCVRGNHDQWVIDYQAIDGYEHPVQSETLQFLESLPLSRNYLWEGKRVFITHASTWSIEESPTHHHPEDYKRLVASVEADIILLGHSHMATFTQVNDVTVINPGAVYSNLTEDYRTCAILLLPETIVKFYNLANGQWFATGQSITM